MLKTNKKTPNNFARQTGICSGNKEHKMPVPGGKKAFYLPSLCYQLRFPRVALWEKDT